MNALREFRITVTDAGSDRSFHHSVFFFTCCFGPPYHLSNDGYTHWCQRHLLIRKQPSSFYTHGYGFPHSHSVQASRAAEEHIKPHCNLYRCGIAEKRTSLKYAVSCYHKLPSFAESFNAGNTGKTLLADNDRVNAREDRLVLIHFSCHCVSKAQSTLPCRLFVLGIHSYEV